MDYILYKINIIIIISVAPGKMVMLFGVGAEIRQFIPGAKGFEYSDVILSGRRIQVFAISMLFKLTPIMFIL